jgi:hypothetical protein
MAKKSTITQYKYDKDNTVRYALKLNVNTDKEIIDIINDTVKTQKLTKQGAIKYLIKKAGY